MDFGRPKRDRDGRARESKGDEEGGIDEGEKGFAFGIHDGGKISLVPLPLQRGRASVTKVLRLGEKKESRPPGVDGRRRLLLAAIVVGIALLVGLKQFLPGGVTAIGAGPFPSFECKEEDEQDDEDFSDDDFDDEDDAEPGDAGEGDQQ